MPRLAGIALALVLALLPASLGAQSLEDVGVGGEGASPRLPGQAGPVIHASPRRHRAGSRPRAPSGLLGGPVPRGRGGGGGGRLRPAPPSPCRLHPAGG